MRVRVITSLREFDAIAPAWKEITASAGQGSPFLSHDWFACCWRTAGPNRRRELWMLEDAAGPLALLPLARWRSRVSGLPVRVIGFLDAPGAPFVDVPAARATDTDDWIRTFLAHARRQNDWDVISLRKLPAESRTLRALEAGLAEGFSWRRGESQYAPYVRITGSWEDLVDRRERLDEARARIEGQLEERPNALLVLHANAASDESLRMVTRLRKAMSSATLPIVVVTAKGREELMTKALEAGADDCLESPMHPPLALARIPREKLVTATAAYGMARNLGGSIGIAVVTTLIAQRSQLHQSILVGRVTPGDPLTADRLAD